MSFFEKMRKEKLLSVSLLVFTLSLGILIGTLVNTGVRAEKGQAAPDAKLLEIPSPAQLSTAFTQLAKRLEPSVVNIRTEYLPKETTSSQNRRQMTPDQDDPSFEFFRRFFPGQPFGRDVPQFKREGTGSGVVVDSNGYILTNHHVVDKADRIKVKMTGDPNEYEAKLIGTDTETDLAVIKIDTGKGLAPARIGNSDSVQVGDWAVAIGSPFGLEATVTAGIISAKGRDLAGAQFQHFLQTDAAINPGNSGGPLLNINGEVIGINTAIATQSGAYQGVGFALPMNMAVKVYNEIIKSGRVTRGSIGVELQNPKPELLKVYGAPHGTFVSKIESGSPADKAGVKQEDVIIAMNGKPIKASDDLVNAISDSKVGSRITLTVIRDGEKKEIPVTVGDRARIWASRLGSTPLEELGRGEATEAKFGISVQNLTPAHKEELNFDQEGGVLVTQVEPGSFADDLGMRANDIIVEINRQAVKSVDDIRRVQGTLKSGDAVAIKVMRFGLSATRRGERSQQWVAVYLADTYRTKE